MATARNQTKKKQRAKDQLTEKAIKQRVGDLVERLLESGRLEEALQEIHSSSDDDLMGLADQLIAHKHVDLAHTLVRDRLSADEKGRNNSQLREWLKRFSQSRKN